jgi:hypothetical protein
MECRGYVNSNLVICNQKVVMSRKESYPFTNTLVVVNKVWTLKPESPMGQPKLMIKGDMLCGMMQLL